MTVFIGLVTDTFDTQAALDAAAVAQGGAVKLDVAGTLAGNSDLAVPTQKATKTYVDAHSTAGVDIDATMAANSDALVASQKATKTALATKPTAALDVDGTLAANSDVKVASQKAIKTYADTKVPQSATAITGALSTVADAPAKAVLTSIIAQLVALGAATDGTT